MVLSGKGISPKELDAWSLEELMRANALLDREQANEMALRAYYEFKSKRKAAKKTGG